MRNHRFFLLINSIVVLVICVFLFKSVNANSSLAFKLGQEGIEDLQRLFVDIRDYRESHNGAYPDGLNDIVKMKTHSIEERQKFFSALSNNSPVIFSGLEKGKSGS